MKILAMTVCCMDIYPQQNVTCVGGNSLNFATQCVRNGIRDVAVLGAIGNDCHGAAIRKHLVKHNIDVSHLHTRAGSTASSDIYVLETGETHSPDECWRGGVYQTFRLSQDDWEFARSHDIVAILSVDPNFRESIRQTQPAKLVVDFLNTRDYDLMEEVIGEIDIAFISGDADVVTRLERLAASVDTLIVVTLGNQGSIAFHQGARYKQCAVPVAHVVDVTGCGDAYQAAFTIAWFQGHGVRAAMASGADAASHILAHYGAVAHA